MGTKNNPGEWDCYAKAEPDEPMFTLLGRDATASGLVDQWADSRELLIEHGLKPASDRSMVEEARICASEMRAFALRRGSAAIKPLGPRLYRPCLEPPYFVEKPEETTATGRPAIDEFGSAIQLWSLFQEREATIEEASAVFNVPIEMVRQAVEEHYWMFLGGKDGNVIEHEGE